MTPEQATRGALVCVQAARVFEASTVPHLVKHAGGLRWVAELLDEMYEPHDLMRDKCAIEGCDKLVDPPTRYCTQAHRQKGYRQRKALRQRDTSAHAERVARTIDHGSREVSTVGPDGP